MAQRPTQLSPAQVRSQRRKRKQAIERIDVIATALGWYSSQMTSVADVLALPLGDTQQQEELLAACKLLEDSDLPTTLEPIICWQAMRLGWHPSLALAHLPDASNDRITAAVIRSCGPDCVDKFFTDPINGDSWNNKPRYQFSLVRHAVAAIVILAQEPDRPIPTVPAFLEKWTELVEEVLSGAPVNHTEDLPTKEELGHRFLGFVNRAIEVEIPVSGQFGVVLVLGVQCGFIGRNLVIELLLQVLDRPMRTNEFTQLLRILTEELALTGAEIIAHSGAAKAVITQLNPAVVKTIGLLLIQHCPEPELADVFITASYVGPAKIKAMVLKMLASREITDTEVQATIAPRLVEIIRNEDKKSAVLAKRICAMWNMAIDHDSIDATEKPLTWQPAPPVWSVPAFVVEKPDVDQISQLGAQLPSNPNMATLLLEQFLAQLVELSYVDDLAARRAVAGVSAGAVAGMVHDWSLGSLRAWGRWGRKLPMAAARLHCVLANLGSLPCLLSTPTLADLSITADDLLLRIKRYHAENRVIYEPDLALALTRLRPVSAVNESLRDEFVALNVPVEILPTKMMRLTAGELVARYLLDPFIDSGLQVAEDGQFTPNIVQPDSWELLPARQLNPGNVYSVIFPHFGDSVSTALNRHNTDRDMLAQLCQQLPFAARPLEPGTVANLISLLCPAKTVAFPEAEEAIRIAWRRGLLQPGVFDVSLLGWGGRKPRSRDLVEPLYRLATEGLVSVIWYVLDGLASLPQPTRVLEAMLELAPVVVEAVDTGNAPINALDLPGVHASLARSNPATAKLIHALLQAVGRKNTGNAVNRPIGTFDTRYCEQQWSATAEAQDLVNDGITVGLHDDVAILSRDGDPYTYAANFLFTWEDSLSTGRWLLYRQTPNSQRIEYKSKVYCYMVDGAVKFGSAHDQSLSGIETHRTPDFVSICLVLYSPYKQSIVDLLLLLIRKQRIGAAAIRNALQRTWEIQPAWKPTKILGALKRHAELLPSLWPVLTVATLQAAERISEGERAPTWLNTTLDICIDNAVLLGHATNSGYISRDAWVGIEQLASSRRRSAYVVKAQRFLEYIN